jgi:hypothetical protein
MLPRDEVARLLRGSAQGESAQDYVAHPYDPSSPVWAAADADGVHLLLANEARASGGDAAWAEASRDAASAMLRRAAAVALLRELELTRLLQRVHAAGIECVIFKGAALAHTLYAQPYLRPRNDADLLIRRRDLDRVIATIESAGYERAIETSGEWLSAQMHFDRADAPRGLHALDVHWKISNPIVFSDALLVEECLAAAVPAPALGAGARTLSRVHALLAACIHRVAHHQDEPVLLWLWDVHLLVQAMSADEREQATIAAARNGTAAVCARSLDLTAAYFETAHAREMAAALRHHAGARHEPSAAFVGGGLRQIDLLASDLRSLTRWRDRAALVREHLLPPGAYMRSLYAHWPPALLPFAYVHRAARGATRWFRDRS